MSSIRRFPILALVILIIGVVAIASLVLLFLFSTALNPSSNVISIAQAKQSADNYVAGISSELKVAEIMEFQNNFYVRVQEKTTGINAFELLVDRYAGRVTPEPGPNMMWNTKYGMMGGSGRTPTDNMPVSTQQATEYAQTWLDANIPGTKVENPETFYGYYTIDVSRNGATYGMLSVSGYSGEVWYHTWHGQFIAETEYD